MKNSNDRQASVSAEGAVRSSDPASGPAVASAAQVYIVARWLYIEEGEGFSIEGVFASEGAAQTFIDSEPIHGNRYSIFEKEVRDA